MSTEPKRVTATGSVPSPCISVCVMDPASGYCIGCRRTIDEIASWSVLTDDDKRAVLAALAQRRTHVLASGDGRG